MIHSSSAVKPFDISSLDPASLAGYREDLVAKKRFERRFMLPTLTGGVLLFGSIIAHLLGKIPERWTPVLVVAGFVILMGTVLWQFCSRPVSTCGKPMRKYWSSTPKNGNTEAVYVCDESKTYFIRVWGRRSSSTSFRD